MKLIPIVLLAFPTVFTACAPTDRVEKQVTAEEPANPAAPTDRERELLDAVNKARRDAGKPALAPSAILAALAQSESANAAAAGELPADAPASLRRRSGFESLGRLQGTLQDRGPRTASFVSYWQKDAPEMLAEGWSAAGVGVTKGADGRLFAIVLLGRNGSGDVMAPADLRSGSNPR